MSLTGSIRSSIIDNFQTRFSPHLNEEKIKLKLFPDNSASGLSIGKKWGNFARDGFRRYNLVYIDNFVTF